jgi:hypothetical protein
MSSNKKITSVLLAASLTACLSHTAMAAQPDVKVSKANIVSHWSKERRTQAIPRDMVIDKRGLGYLRLPNGNLRPHGHTVSALEIDQRRGKPSSNTDTTPPVIHSVSPADGSSFPITDNVTFSANVTDAESGVKSVSFIINGQGYAGELVGDIWQMTGSFNNAGSYSWSVEAKDNVKKGANSATSEPYNLTITEESEPPTPPPATGGLVIDEEWTAGGKVQTAAGRIFFEMPTNKRKTRWAGYVCSGTVVTDENTNQSVILTAAHCVYDDAYNTFARRVLFIPNQAGTSGIGTDRDCANDPLGCWVPELGVVEENWTLSTFPNNKEWDYAYYVVSNNLPKKLEDEAGSLPVSFTTPNYDLADDTDFTHALGYSYEHDPEFRYCAEEMETEGLVNWWLPSCGLSGGASGGPWIQPMSTTSPGEGIVMSVNSWGYTTAPGMAGPKLSDSSAECMFNIINAWDVLPSSGVIVDNCP